MSELKFCIMICYVSTSFYPYIYCPAVENNMHIIMHNLECSFKNGKKISLHILKKSNKCDLAAVLDKVGFLLSDKHTLVICTARHMLSIFIRIASVRQF